MCVGPALATERDSSARLVCMGSYCRTKGQCRTVSREGIGGFEYQLALSISMASCQLSPALVDDRSYFQIQRDSAKEKSN